VQDDRLDHGIDTSADHVVCDEAKAEPVIVGRVRFVSIVTACAIASGGCAAGGLAAVGPVLSAVQAVTDRTVERTVAADVATARALAHEGLTRIAIPVESEAGAGEGWTMRGVSKGLTVDVTLTPATERLTRIAVRVEAAGWLTADKQTGEELHNQIARVLAEHVAARPVPSAQADALAALEAQVRSLRSELARRRDTVPPVSATEIAEPKSVMSVDTSAIISVPASYGFATVPPLSSDGGTAPSAVRPVQEAVTPSPARVPKLRPTTLESAGTLTAVPALGSGD
jgi:hypothetical protein